MGLSYEPPGQPTVVPYMDLGGGLNMRLEPHALQRNELAVSINLWSSYDFAVAKRPGSQALVAPNGTVNASNGQAPGPCKSLLACRFNAQTYLIYVALNGNAFIAPALLAAGNIGLLWRFIGKFNPDAAFVTCAQMFNPNSQSQAVFFCDGMSVPQFLKHENDTLVDVPTGAGNLPARYGGGLAGPITPQYVKTLGNNSHLFYSGEKTNPSAVYISDPFYPTTFTNFAMQVTSDPAGSSYYPAIIGNNDGVEGGPISGMESLGSAMVIFKDAACYAMIQTTLLGEVPAWQVVEISNSTGCVAPLSLARFSTFIVFLSIDGVYTTDGNTVTQISPDVGPIFDSTLTGFHARVTLPTIARGVRHGMRYEIFYSTANLNYCNEGVWFDFTKQSRFGNPVAGMITGMAPAGLASLRGPGDDGNVAWGDALINRVGEFGIGYSDFDAPISVAMAGKADLFDDVFGPEACVGEKQMQDAYALVELVNVAAIAPEVDFFGSVIVNLELTLARVMAQLMEATVPGALWGVGAWGNMRWGSSAGANFGIVKIPCQNGARGTLLQIAIKETSHVPWVLIGYCTYVNFQKVGY